MLYATQQQNWCCYEYRNRNFIVYGNIYSCESSSLLEEIQRSTLIIKNPKKQSKADTLMKLTRYPVLIASNLWTTISHINYWDQVNSWKNLWKFWNGPLCRNKSDPSPLLNVAVYWQSSNTETCVKKLPQILANNIDNGGRGIGLRIYVRYCRYGTK